MLMCGRALLDHRAEDRLREIERAAQVVLMTVSQSSIDIRIASPSRVTPACSRDVDLGEVFQNFSAGFLHGGVIGHIDRVIFR